MSDQDKTQFRNPASGVTAPQRNTTTGSSWDSPGSWSQQDSVPLVTGSVIKSRFILEESIGSGGMGTVFKARDLRKEEAQDRHPYVAIKVLNEDFKRHPESLKALQRESRKAQKLAHPNIVNVYDFDRDGGNVYMVMELLEGEPLDRVIKRAGGYGLELKEAIRIIRDICLGMEYAHKEGIVHADFKPANAFLTTAGVAKVLDFGIARVAKLIDHSEGTDSATEGVTLFDPGTLGALTPAYAGCEVIEGEDPEPRDDVYAIACVAYELITGTHPFSGLSATQAENARLVPKQPSGLSTRQWRTLRRALSPRRDGRPMSAIGLLDGIRPLRLTRAMYIAVGAATLTALALAGMLLFDLGTHYRENRAAAILASADASRIGPMLGELRAMDSAQRASLFVHDDARAGLMRFFEQRANSLVDASKGRYDYPQAEQQLRELDVFFPDSQAVRDVRDRLLERKREEIKRQSDAFDSCLEQGWLIPAQNRQNVGVVLAVIRQIDPQNPLLHDPRLPGAFAQGAREALQRGGGVLAAALVTAGLVFAPGDAMLTDLRDQAQQALGTQKLRAREAVLEQAVKTLTTSANGLAALEGQSGQVDELRSMNPSNQALVDLQQHVEQLLEQQMAGLIEQRQFDAALSLLDHYADWVSPDYVRTKRQELSTDASNADLKTAAAEEPATPQDSGAQSTPSPPQGSTAEWQAQLQEGLQQSSLSLTQAQTLASLVYKLTAHRDPDAKLLRHKLIVRLVQNAAAVRSKQGVNAAITFTKGAYALFPESPSLKKTLVDLFTVAAQHASTQRDTELAHIKDSIESLLSHPTLDDAWDSSFKRELLRLADYVPETDPYVADVKAHVSRLYVSQAATLRSSQRLTEASRMLERSHEYQQQSSQRDIEEALLADARTRQELGEKELDRGAYVSSLKQKLIIQADANDVTAAATSLRVLGQSLPADDRFMAREGPEAIAQAYERLAWTALREGRFNEAVELIDHSHKLVPAMEPINKRRTLYLHYQALDEYLTHSSTIDVRKARVEISALSQEDPGAMKIILPILARDFAARIHAVDDPESARQLLLAARAIFSGGPVQHAR